MTDIWRALQWWDDWELRILVLGSLGLQWFLLLAAPMRKFTIPHFWRTCIWLAYISSDALAIYALATIFNRHARASSNLCGAAAQSSSTLEVLWAPILLIHLGGQKEMTGYEIEDNELWTRHTVTLVSQVAVALYAFCKSWHSTSDGKVMAAAVLLFVVGVASLSEKPFALNRAKTKRLAAVSAWMQETTKHSRWTEHISQFFVFGEGRGFRLSTGSGKEEEDSKPAVALTDAEKLLMVLSDMSLLATASDMVERGKARSLEEVLPPLPVAERALGRWLRNAFSFIYTRAIVSVTPLYLVYHFLVVPIMHIAALTLFARSDKDPYKRADVKITCIILCLTAALDVLAELIRQLLYRIMSVTKVPALCETVPSYNLIDAALSEGGMSIGWIYRCASRMGSFFCRPQHAQLYRKVAQTVIIDLLDARDLSSYRIFDSTQYTNNTTPIKAMEPLGSSPHSKRTASNWALSKELQEHCGVCGVEIRKSLCAVPFDRSILIWHIATDLCRRCCIDEDGSEEKEGEEKVEEEEEEEWEGFEEEQQQHKRKKGPVVQLHMECTFAISNYMAHLLNANPEMLLTGSRHHLISKAVKEFNKYFLLSKKKDTLTQKDINLILSMEHKSVDDDSQVFHIKEACKLAKELLELQYSTRWKLMYRVWLGMLCYSASMCRGYLHAKSLGEGGEFLSFVWLMLVLKGAGSLADKLQMPPET